MVKIRNSSNKEVSISTELDANYITVPVVGYEKKFDEYKQYLKEKEESKKYRLIFNINPICSNVLFNNISEIIYKEGSDECIDFVDDREDVSSIDGICDYLNYKGITGRTIARMDLIRDTGFSHPEIGPIVYHCGYDIFNNHTLRQKEFTIVNKLRHRSDGSVFNTISDYRRDCDGNQMYETMVNFSGTIKDIKTHLYQMSTISSFVESIDNNLVEDNGWVGFVNKCTLDIPNYVYTVHNDDGDEVRKYNISLNKTMNNNKNGEFIDMYPDRSLYSFIPKINKYRNNRIEPNWDFCLTYPYENFYNHELVQYENEDKNIVVNGIKARIVYPESWYVKYKYDTMVEKMRTMIEGDENGEGVSDGYETITLSTLIKNNFKKGSILKFDLIGEINSEITHIAIGESITVNYVSEKSGEQKHHFTIYSEKLFECLRYFDNPLNVEIRVKQVVNDCVCRYYFRKFKKITKKENGSYKFNHSFNKIGFSKNVYGDNYVELLINDDVHVTGLKDNLGRDISEMYLTIIKNNKGYKEWYGDATGKTYKTHENVTFSHCFGEVTSGIDIYDRDEYDYNIHKIHNVPTGVTDIDTTNLSDKTGRNYLLYKTIFKEVNEGEYVLPKVLENDITVDDVVEKYKEKKDWFYGDIVELSPSTVEEITLEKVYHRFNTAQREKYTYRYRNLYIDEIKRDDYDYMLTTGSTEFALDTQNKYNVFYNKETNWELLNIPINISPEGYFYQPHYKIALKKYKTTVEEGYHTRINIEKVIDTNYKTTAIVTDKNYFLEVGTDIFLYDIKNGYKKKTATVIKVGESPFTNVVLYSDAFDDDKWYDKYLLFKPNVLKPSYAVEYENGTGKYTWRELKDDSEYEAEKDEIGDYIFTNGCHYINKNINFFLRRQDPDGSYGLSNSSSEFFMLSNLSIFGNTKDIKYEEYYDMDIEGTLC